MTSASPERRSVPADPRGHLPQILRIIKRLYIVHPLGLMNPSAKLFPPRRCLRNARITSPRSHSPGTPSRPPASLNVPSDSHIIPSSPSTLLCEKPSKTASAFHDRSESKHQLPPFPFRHSPSFCCRLRQSHHLHLMQNDLHGLITADSTAAFRHGTVRYRFRNRICHRLLQDQHRNIVSRQSLRHLFKSGPAYRKIRLLFLQRFQSFSGIENADTAYSSALRSTRYVTNLSRYSRSVSQTATAILFNGTPPRLQ